MKTNKNAFLTAFVLAMLVVLSGVTISVENNVVGSTDQNTGTNATTEQKIGGAVYNGSKDMPLESAYVVLYTTDGGQTKELTDENGTFVFEDLDVGTYLIVVFKESFLPQTQLFTLRKAQSITRDFILKSIASVGVGRVDGYVRNETNIPISSADVSIYGIKTNRDTKTDSTGYFSFDDVLEGPKGILVLKRGFLPGKINVDVTTNITTTKNITVKSIGGLKSYTIQGNVISNGTLVENATVFLRAPSLVNESLTDENGQYVVEDISEGRAVLKISHPDLIEQDVALDVKTNGVGVLDAFLYRGWLFERDLGNIDKMKKEIEIANEIIGKKTMEIKEIESGRKNITNKAEAKVVKEKEINSIYAIVKVYEKLIEDIRNGLPLADIDFVFLPGSSTPVIEVSPDEVNGSITIKVNGTLRAGIRENVTVVGETTIEIKGNVTNSTTGILADGKMEIHSVGNVTINKKSNIISLKGELIFDGGEGKLNVLNNTIVKTHGIGHSRIKTKLENNVLSLNFTLADKEVELPEGMLFGRVVDNQDVPIPNATIVVVEGFGYTVKNTTDSLGNYVIPNIPVGKAILMVVKRGYIPDKRIIEVKLSTIEDFKLIKPSELPKGIVGGIVINESGVPIKDAKVFLRSCANSYRGETGVNGSFAVKDIVAGEYIVEVTAPGYLQKIDVVNVVGKRTFILKTMLKKVPPRQKIAIEGTVTNETDTLASNAVLDVRGFGFGNRTQTNTTGYYALTNISEGVYILTAYKTNYALQNIDLGVVYDRKNNKTYALLTSGEFTAERQFDITINKTSETEISKVDNVLPSVLKTEFPELSQRLQLGALYINYTGNASIGISGGEVSVSGVVNITVYGNVSNDANVTGFAKLMAKGHIVVKRASGSFEIDGQLVILDLNPKGKAIFTNNTANVTLAGKGIGVLSVDVVDGKMTLNIKVVPVTVTNNVLKGRVVYIIRGEMKPLKNATVVIKGTNVAMTLKTDADGKFETNVTDGLYWIYADGVVTTGGKQVRLTANLLIGIKGGETKDVVLEAKAS